MYYNNKYKHLEAEVREKMVFDTDTRMRIRQKLKLSEASFNNCLTELRKQGIIKDNKLSKTYNIFTLNKTEELIFRFYISSEVNNSKNKELNGTDKVYNTVDAGAADPAYATV
jgi:DNA-binding Lrp family transcriptional regulator